MVVFNKKLFKNLNFFSNGAYTIDILTSNTQLNSKILFLEKDFKMFENLSKKKKLKNNTSLNVSVKYRKNFLS